MSTYDFRQVDVFSAEPLKGNPVAVVHGADDLSEEQMAAFARWTNLSETTFLLTPTDPRADYRLRIFTPSAELPFAGHPTLGSAHAWLEAGGVPKVDGGVVQECAAGLITVATAGGRLAFAAPPLVRSGSAEELRGAIAESLRVDSGDIVAVEWIDNGPGWIGVRMADAATVSALTPDFVTMDRHDLKLGVVGPHPAGSSCAVEVRAFSPDIPGAEDPVTGSLNAGLAQWLIGEGILPEQYVAAQGAALGRAGRVHVRHEDGEFWIGGDTATTILGQLALGS